MCRNLASIIFFVFSCLHSLPGQDSTLTVLYTPEKGLHMVRQIQSGQTVFQLSRYLGVDMTTIQKANSGINLDQIHIGQELVLPLSKGKIVTQFMDDQYLPVIYQVKKSENWFRIARIYVEGDIALLKKLNGLKNNDLSTGQVLQLGWIQWPGPATTPFPPDNNNMDAASPSLAGTITDATVDLDVTLKPASPTPEPTDEAIEVKSADVVTFSETWSDSSFVQITGPPISDTLLMKKEVTKKGIAFWDRRDSTAVEFLALHRTAPVNSKIVLYNPMMDRRVVATVVSNLEENSYPENISVVISPSVATALGALDRRFLVEMTYFE